MRQLSDSLKTAITNMTDSISAGLPKVVMLLALILVGWIVGRLVRALVTKALKMVKLQEAMDKLELTPMLLKMGIADVAKFLGKLCFWLIMMIVAITAAETVKLEMISSGLAAMVAYLPKLLSGLVIFLIGMFMANAIKKVVYTATDSIGLTGSQVISNIVYYVLLIFVTITAINQTGIDTSLVTSNITLLFAAVLFAFAISYGFASRDIMTNMLSSFYTKDRFKVGMKVRIGDVSGDIIDVSNLSVTVASDGKKVVIPVKKLISEQIEILD